MRIVSLLASATELVCAIGAGESLVGRSHECDEPEWVRRLPAVSRPTFDVSGPSAEIDRLVREHLAAGRPLYEIDEERLVSLAPDVLLTQTHCEVCAVTPADVGRGGAPALRRREVVALRTGTLEGILEGFLEVASVLGREKEGEALVRASRERVAGVRARTSGLERPRVACLEWIDPVFTMGNWGPEIVDAAGGEAFPATAGVHSTAMRWEVVHDADPDVMVVAPCGFSLARAMAEMPALQARPGWRDMRAVRDGRVFVADGNRFFNRSGPSAFETVELLAEMLHPDVFAPRHRGVAWQRLSS